MRRQYKNIQAKNEIKKTEPLKSNNSRIKRKLEEKKFASDRISKLNLNSSYKKNIMSYSKKDPIQNKNNTVAKNNNKSLVNKSNIISKIFKIEINKSVNKIDNKSEYSNKKKSVPDYYGIDLSKYNRIRNFLNIQKEKVVLTDNSLIQNDSMMNVIREKEKEKEKDYISDNITKKSTEKDLENNINEDDKDIILNEENQKDKLTIEEDKKIRMETIIDDQEKKTNITTYFDERTFDSNKDEKNYNTNSSIESSKIYKLIKKCKNKAIYNSSIIDVNYNPKRKIMKNEEKNEDKKEKHRAKKNASFLDLKSTNTRNRINNSLIYLNNQSNANTNLIYTFNKMNDNFMDITSKKNNINKFLSLDQKEGHKSKNKHNSSFSSISNLFKEFDYDKSNKKAVKNINIRYNKKKIENRNIQKSNSINNLEISPKGRKCYKKRFIGNSGSKNVKSFKITKNVINNNTYNTTYNIYNINNIIPRKDFSSKKKEKSFKHLNRNQKNLLNSCDNKKYHKIKINKNDKKREEKNRKIIQETIGSPQREESFFNKPSKSYQELIINKEILNTNEINVEIIYLLESKIKTILNKINNYEICFNECEDWIIYYFNNNIYDLIINLFDDERNKNNMDNKIKIEILCYFLCYDASFSKNFSQAGILLKTIFHLLHNNFLLLIVFIINNFIKINTNDSLDNYLIDYLNEIVNSELKLNLSVQETHNENCITEIIEQNFKHIDNYYKMIIDNLYNYSYMTSLSTSSSYDKEDINSNKIFKFPQCLSLDSKKLNNNQKLNIVSLFFFDAYKLLNNYNILDLKLFYDLFLNKQNNRNEKNSKNIYKNDNTALSRNNYILNNKSKYVLPEIKSYYQYSLLINLDILVYDNEYSSISNVIINNNKTILLRPGLIKFLKEMKKIYELILFSNNSLDYILEIINNFENNKKLFDYVLSYNQIDFDKFGSIKNLESLGRNINYIIILDKDPSLFKLNNDNIIYVKPFNGDSYNDGNILNNLSDILKKVKEDTEYIDDTRVSISNYKFEILTKISTTLF